MPTEMCNVPGTTVLRVSHALPTRQPYEVGTTVTSISRLAHGSPESELEVAGLGLGSRMFDPKVCTLSLFLGTPVGRHRGTCCLPGPVLKSTGEVPVPG